LGAVKKFQSEGSQDLPKAKETLKLIRGVIVWIGSPIFHTPVYVLRVQQFNDVIPVMPLSQDNLFVDLIVMQI